MNPIPLERTDLPSLRSDAIEELSSQQGLPSYGVEIEYEHGSNFSEDYLERMLTDTRLFINPRKVPAHKFVEQDSWFHMEEEKLSGGELVSRVFSDVLNLEQITDVTTCLQKAGAQVSENSGVHVHVGVETLVSVSSWYDLFNTFYHFQRTLYSVGSSPERTMLGHHRASMSVKPIKSKPPLLGAEDSTPEWLPLILSYIKKNTALTSFNVATPTTGTLEFRLWDATLDPVLIGFYVAVSTALVTCAAEGKLSEPEKIEDLGAVLFSDKPTLAIMFRLLSKQAGHPLLGHSASL